MINEFRQLGNSNIFFTFIVPSYQLCNEAEIPLDFLGFGLLFLLQKLLILDWICFRFFRRPRTEYRPYFLTKLESSSPAPWSFKFSPYKPRKQCRILLFLKTSSEESNNKLLNLLTVGAAFPSSSLLIGEENTRWQFVWIS